MLTILCHLFLSAIANRCHHHHHHGLQILGCELHQNAFGGLAAPRPAVEAIVLPIDRLAVIREGRKGKGKKRVRNRQGGKGG